MNFAPKQRGEPMSDFEKTINASDLIEWIMETFPDWCVGAVRTIVDHVNALPSAQPEIVRCRDCRYWGLTNFVHEPTGWCGRQETTRNPDWYCADGERRGEER